MQVVMMRLIMLLVVTNTCDGVGDISGGDNRCVGDSTIVCDVTD